MWRTYVCPIETRGSGREINRRIEYWTLQFTFIYRSDYNNCKVATLRRKGEQKKKQNKTNRHFSPRSLAKTDPPGLILQVSTLFLSHLSPFFFVPYDFTIDYLLTPILPPPFPPGHPKRNTLAALLHIRWSFKCRQAEASDGQKT
jgi:hypothetical protein